MIRSQLARRAWQGLTLMVSGFIVAAILTPSIAQDRRAPSADPMLRVDTPMHQAMIRRLVVGADGARLVTAGDDKTIRIWQREAPTGQPQTLRLAQTLRVPMDSGHEGQLFALAMSPDGKRIAAGGWTCWDWERAGCVYIFDVESGAIVRRLRGLPDAVSALAWSADGRHLAIGLQGRAGVRVLRTDTFEEVAADRAYDDKVMELAYGKDGRLAAVALDGRLRVYRNDHRLHGRISLSGGSKLATVRFNADASRLAVGFLDAPVVAVVDASSFAPLALRRIEDQAQRNLSNVAWSQDGRTLYAAGERSNEGANVLHRWRATGQGVPDVQDAVAIPAQRVSELQALPGGALAYSAEDPRLGIVDAQGQLVVDRVGEITDFSDERFVLRLSADGAAIAYSDSAGRERVFALDAQPGASASAPAVATRAMASAIREAAGWRVERSADRLALRVNGQAAKLDDYEIVRAHAFNPAGDALFVGTEWALRRIDRAGAEVWRVQLAAIVRALVVSADGQWLVAALSDGTIRWFRARDGTQTLAYFAHANAQDWIAWTPAGYYLSSLRGDELVGWHVNRGADQTPDFYRAVQFERVLYRPDIVSAALQLGARPSTRQVSEPERFDPARLAQIAPPRLAVQVLGITTTAEGAARARIRVTGERGAQALRELTVYVNEVPVTLARERAVGWTETGRLTRELEVSLNAGPNDIRVESYTDVSMGVAERFVSIEHGRAAQAPQGDLYVLAIGNNVFPGLPPASHLEFAARDAEALAAALGAGARGTFRSVHVEVLSDERAKKADRKTVLDSLAFTRRARAEDTVVIFLASHGVSDRAGNYWFVPRDASIADLKAIENSSPEAATRPDSLLSWTVFFDALRDTAGRRLLIVDTCQAKGIEGRFESFSLLKRSAASRFSLMVAAQSNEESQEYPPGRHGLFTYALLQGLSADLRNPPVDSNGDGQVSVAELFAVAAPVVARLHDRALGTQTPALMAPAALLSSPLAAARRF